MVLKQDKKVYQGVQEDANFIAKTVVEMQAIKNLSDIGLLHPDKKINPKYEFNKLRSIKTCLGGIYNSLELWDVESVYDGVFFTRPESEWLITDRLPNEELKMKLMKLDDKYAGNLVRHKKTGNTYYVAGFTCLNMDGAAEIAVMYQPYCVDKQEVITRRITHTRPAREFFDGRFEGAIFDELT